VKRGRLHDTCPAGGTLDAEFDIASLVVDTEAQVYCCGPESLMSSVAACVPAAQMHCERFIVVLNACIAWTHI
jgi:ferredoxin-NADP reductase